MKSWLKYTLRTAAILLTATLLTTSCLQSDFDEPLLAGDTVQVSFNPTLDNNETTRVGEGKSVNKLYAELYLNGELIGERHVYEVSSGNISGFSMELLKNQTYTIVFWAQNESCGAYDTNDLSNIKITYPENIAFSDIENYSDIEKYDAFYAKCDVKVDADTIRDGVNIQLTRPFALVIAGTDEEVETNTTSSLTFSSIATQFDAFTGKASVGAEKTISFQPNGTKVPGKEQVMLGIAYVLPMPNPENTTVTTTVTVTTTLDGQSKDTGINIPNLTANKRYNLLGSNLVVDAGWGGTTYLSLPDVATDGWIHITEAEQLATLLRDGYDNSENTINGIHLCASFNMGGKVIEPTATATFKNVIIDGAAYSVNSTSNLDTPIDENRITVGGGIYELKGLNISGKGVFNSTDTFTARYIKFTNVTVNSAAEAGGVVGTATGSLTLTNITVSGEVTGANKVGGLVGYIDSATGTTATLTDCSSSATVNATAKAGALVGWFDGYDESETLNFIDCSTTSESTFTTPFCGAEQACFNTNDLELSTYEQHLLGGEEYCRGTINYGYVDGDGNLTSERFFYRWDGVRKVTPLTENSSTSIYSPYDLADCQGKSITSMTFYNDVDMGGTEADFNKTGTSIRDDMSFKFTNEFKSLNSVSTLDGRNCTIYNLRIDRRNTGSGAFILNGGGTHKNLTFDGAYIVVTHVTPITNANAYAGTLSAMNYSTYTIENVDCKNGKIFAICKMGGLIGGFAKENSDKLTCKNCDIDNYYLENYVVDYDDTFNVGQTTTIAGMQVSGTATQTFITSGEVGGLIGFIKGNAEITHCSVKNSVINCYGQPDLETRLRAVVGTSGSLDGYGYYLVAGRHVNQFIGDLYPIGISTVITLQDNTISNNSYGANNSVNQHNNHFYEFSRQKKNEGSWLKPKNYAYYTIKKETPYAGCVYYVGIQMEMGGTTYTFADELGTVKIDDLTLDSIGEVVGGPVNDISLLTDLNKINKTIRLVYDLN